MAKVLVAGLNPAWQKILEFGSFSPGEVNRAASLIQLASGKGMNAAKVLRRLGHEVHLLQVLGGANGQRCLVACQALGIASLHAWIEEETRTCTTLVDRALGTATEIIEPFEIEADGVSDALVGMIPPGGGFDAVLVCGTAPQGLPAGLYGRILDRAAAPHVLLDACKEVDAALLDKASWVKVNRKEYGVLAPLGTGLRPDFLVTDGAADAEVLRAGKAVHRIAPPRLERAPNPIGAGDAVAGGTLHFLLDGLEPAEAFRRGMAMGSASCLDLEPAQFAWDDYERLLRSAGPVRSAR
jgi:fructose-1-phosphate kinase PfkB-like protein